MHERTETEIRTAISRQKTDRIAQTPKPIIKPGLEIRVNKSKIQQYCTDNGIAYEFDNENVPVLVHQVISNVKIEK